jgi:hypothetical protein
MKILYKNEYGDTIYQSTQDVPSSQIPSITDTVVIDQEEWKVTARVFHPAVNTVVVVLAQDVSRLLPPASTTESSKTASLTRAIEKLSSRQDSIEKKSRALNEQIVTIRKNINQRIQQDKKDQS